MLTRTFRDLEGTADSQTALFMIQRGHGPIVAIAEKFFVCVGQAYFKVSFSKGFAIINQALT
jgi:hypothetical protein